MMISIVGVLVFVGRDFKVGLMTKVGSSLSQVVVDKR